MGRKKDITSKEKQDIVKLLSDGNTTLEIAKKLNRDHRTIKKEIENIDKIRTRKKTGFKNVTKKDLSKMRSVISKKSGLTSKKIFEEVGVSNVNREKRCRILRTLTKDMKVNKLPHLSKHHKEKRVIWAKKYMKTDFSTVMFSDECRATVDGPES